VQNGLSSSFCSTDEKERNKGRGRKMKKVRFDGRRKEISKQMTEG
jgi:hypothetical protein